MNKGLYATLTALTLLLSLFSVSHSVSASNTPQIISLSLNKEVYNAGEPLYLNAVIDSGGYKGSLDLRASIIDERGSIVSDKVIYTLRGVTETAYISNALVWNSDYSSRAGTYYINLSISDSNKTLSRITNAASFNIINVNEVTDIVAPTLTINHSPPASFCEKSKCSPVTISINAKDNKLVKSVTLYLDDSKIKSWNGTSEKFSTTYELSLSSGLHNYRVEARDSNNVVHYQDSIVAGQIETRNFVLFMVPPVANIKFIINGKTYYSDSTGTIHLKVQPGTLSIEAVEEIKELSKLEKITFKHWEGELNSPSTSKKVEITVNSDTTLKAIYDPEHKVIFTSKGLPDNTKVELNVEASHENMSWRQNLTTPFTFVTDWIPTTGLSFSMSPIVNVKSSKYILKSWESSESFTKVIKDRVQLAEGLILTAVYELASAKALVVETLSPILDSTVNGELVMKVRVKSSGVLVRDAKVDFYVDGFKVGSSVSDEEGYALFSMKGLPDGLHTWYVSAEKEGYNFANSDIIKFVYENKRSLDLAFKTNKNTYYAGENVRINATITNLTNKPIDNVRLYAVVFNTIGEPLAKGLVMERDLQPSESVIIERFNVWSIPISASGNYRITISLKSDTEELITSIMLNILAQKKGKFEPVIELSSNESIQLDLLKLTPNQPVNIIINSQENELLRASMKVQEDDDIDLKLSNPEGQLITVSENKRGQSESVEIYKPQSGNWTLSIVPIALNGKEALAKITIQAYDNSGIDLKTIKSKTVYDFGDRVKLYFAITNTSSEPITINGDAQIRRNGALVAQKSIGSMNIEGGETRIFKRSIWKIPDVTDLDGYRVDLIFHDLEGKLYAFESVNTFSIKPVKSDYVQFTIGHDNAAELDIALGILGKKEQTLITSDPSSKFNRIEVITDLSDIGFTEEDWKDKNSIWYLKVSDRVKGKEGSIEYFKISFKGFTYEFTDITPIRDNTDAIIFLPRLSTFIHNDLRYDSNDINANFAVFSADELEQTTMSASIYREAISQYLTRNYNFSMPACSSIGVGQKIDPSLCVNISNGNVTLFSEVFTDWLAKTLNKFKHISLVLKDETGKVNTNLVNATLIIIPNNDNTYNLYFGKNIISSRALLPYTNELESRQSIIVPLIQSSDTLAIKSSVIGQITSKQGISRAAKLISSEAPISTTIILNNIKSMMSEKLLIDLTSQVEYNRVYEIVKDYASIPSQKTVGQLYLLDYIGRNVNLFAVKIGSDFDRVLRNVAVSDDKGTVTYFDAVLMKGEQAVGVVVMDHDFLKTSTTLKNDINSVLDSIKKGKFVDTDLSIEAFSVKPKVITVGTKDGDAKFDFKLSLSTSDFKKIFTSI